MYAKTMKSVPLVLGGAGFCRPPSGISPPC